MLDIVIVAADVEIFLGFVEERAPGFLQDAVVAVVAVGDKGVMADGDEPLGGARLGGFGL